MMNHGIKYKNNINQQGSRTFTEFNKYTSKSPFKKEENNTLSNVNHQIIVQEELRSTIDQLKRKIVDLNMTIIHLKNQLKIKETNIKEHTIQSREQNNLTKENMPSNFKQYLSNAHKTNEQMPVQAYSFIEVNFPLSREVRSDVKKKPIINKISKQDLHDQNYIILEKEERIKSLKEKCCKMEDMLVSLENKLSKSNKLLPDIISKANEYKTLYESSIITIESKNNEINDKSRVIDQLKKQIKDNENDWNIKSKNMINESINEDTVKWERILEKVKNEYEQDISKKQNTIDQLTNEILSKDKVYLSTENQLQEMKRVFLIKGKEFEKDKKEYKDKIIELNEKLSLYEKRVIEAQETMIELKSLQKILQIKNDDIKRLKAQLESN